MRKILLSILTIGIVGGAAFAATQAFFSDTETSTGNVLAAGAIDLLIDNESFVTGLDGGLVASPETSWGIENGDSFFGSQAASGTHLRFVTYWQFDEKSSFNYGSFQWFQGY